MAPFANPLRHIFGRSQPPATATTDSIAPFDGMSDGHIRAQQMHRSTPLQQDNSSDTATVKGSAPPLAGQYEVIGRGQAHQPSVAHLHSQLSQQFAVQQGEDGRNHMQSTMHSTREPGHGDNDHWDESAPQMPSRTATAQPPEASSYRSHIDKYPHATHFQNTATHASAGLQVKQEPAVYEHYDHDIFAEFTNEEFHDENARMSAETQQASECAEHTASDAPWIKQEPISEGLLSVDAAERARTVTSTITAGRNTVEDVAAMPNQQPEASAVVAPHPALEISVSTSSVRSEPGHSQSQGSFGLDTRAEGSQQQHSFEQGAQDPQQSAIDSQAPPSGDKSLRSPSVDSVSGFQRHSSEDTAVSLSGMDLAANARLIEQQWRERHKLLGMGPLTPEAVHASPILLHGPRPSEEQYGQSIMQPVSANHPPYSLPSYQTQPANRVQRSSACPYNLSPQHPIDPLGLQHGQAHSRWMPPSFALSQSMLQAPLPSHQPVQGPFPYGSTHHQRITELQEEEDAEASDDDEPLATRAPRHRSTTASPVPANAQLPNNSGSNSEPTTPTPKLNVSSVKQDPIIELSDDDEESVEAISWKLPDFEVTYHPPATDKDLPMAKVSILGHPKNLVRSEVALTEDHAHHEMELFLNVFLPAQQALQTPDPEPAHAVINFHTISVMVLEAFVQYEIGDEIGRGYGFHGGNIGNQTLRPSPSCSDSEPTRTHSAKDADVDEIFFAVIDRWRAGLISGKGTLKLIRGCQEFCDIALDVIHYVKEHGLSQPESKKRKKRSDAGVARGPRGGAKEKETKGKATAKRKADAVENKTPAKRAAKVNELQGRKKAKTEVKKTKPKAKSSGVTVIKGKK